MAAILEVLKKDPLSLLDESHDAQESLNLIKSLFDPITKGNSVLDEVYVEGLDASQVWPQVKIILDSVTDNLMFDVIPSLKQKNETKSQDSEEDEEEESNSETYVSDEESEVEVVNEEDDGRELGNSEFESANEEEEEEEDGDDDVVDEEEQDNGDKKDVHGLNDGFFSIDDFNKQILAQENDSNNNNDDEDEIDYFGDIPDSEDEEILYHNDFFDGKQKAKNQKAQSKSKDNGDDDEDEDDEGLLNEDDYDDGMKSAMNDLYDDDEEIEEDEDEEQKQRESEKNLSSFEKQQLKIQREIQQLEKEAIAEKKWAMKGEVKAKDRPADALLTEDLEFERTSKPVPVITKEVTETLEDLIRRRIKEDNFDDLPRRIITDVTNFRPSSTFELSENKSEKSLAQLYEDDYKGESTDAVSEELQKSHDEIKELFQSLSHKLDSLSSAHFIPKPAQKAIDIKVNAPTISMEDAQPLAASSANTLAPQEVFKATRSGNDNEISLKSGEVVARDELSREDKHRLRKANKRKRSKEYNEKKATHKKSKKEDVINTLSKASNVTIIGSKGEQTSVTGALKKDKVKQGTSALKL